MEENTTLFLNKDKYDFEKRLKQYNLDLYPLSIETLQVNITLKCNQACHHCHVDSSPKRTEMMDKQTTDKKRTRREVRVPINLSFRDKTLKIFY